MSLELEVGGSVYTNFTAASCTLRLDSLAGEFTFTAVAPGAQALPFKGGEACKVSTDGEALLTGHIEVVAVSYDSGQHNITVRGRSSAADLLDSTLGEFDDIRADALTLKGLIESVVVHLGLGLAVVDEANPAPFNPAEDLAAPEPGDNAFKFIEKYARKRQVLLTDNAEGDIVIAVNSGSPAAGRVQHIVGAADNNVLSSSFSYDTTGRYNVYALSSSLNPVTLNVAGATDLAALVAQSGGALDGEVRRGRQLVLIERAPYSDGDCEARARWEANVRRARGLAYTATVPGFRVGGRTGELWALNRVYQVVDDFVGKVEPMLTNSITFSTTLEGGDTTTLGFVGKNAYTQFIQPDPYAEEASNVS